MPVSLPLDKMTTEEKLRLMEELWEDLSRNAEKFESPAWHGAELKKREKRIASGKTKFKDWEQAKVDIRRRVT